MLDGPTLLPRLAMRWYHSAGAIIGGLAFGLGISVLVLTLSGVSLVDIWNEFVVFTFLDSAGLALVAVAATPLIIVGLAASIALKLNFWNIGVEGQAWLGAIFCTFVAVGDVGDPTLRLVMMGIAAALGGALWILVPLILKLRLGVNEIITTLMLNYIAFLLVQHLVFGIWKDPASNFPYSETFDPGGERLAMLGWGNVNAGLIIALVLALLLWLLVERSRLGVYIAMAGANARAAFATGVPVMAVVIGAVLASGALSGFAGFVVAAGQEYRLTQFLVIGYGFSAIVIAFLARFNPALTVVVAILMGGLYVAGDTLQVFYQLPRAMIELLQGIILVSVAASDFFARYRLVWRRGPTGAEPSPTPKTRPAARTTTQHGT